MGLLDDAIREHLDLKRRRGADPAEVERAAREALGPVRRSPADVDSDPELGGDRERAYDHELGGDQEVTYHQREPGDWVEFEEEAEPGHALPTPHQASEPSPAWESSVREEPSAAAESPAAQEPLQAGATARPEPDAVQPPVPHRAGSGEHLSEETAEYDIDGTHANGTAKDGGVDAGKDGDDVLEETPEFLQDAPEHDRLWFEQRPPRDFDFDG